MARTGADMRTLLPEGFAELESWVADWAHATQNARWDKRLTASREALQAFYAALLPWLPSILDHVDQYPLGELPEASARLFDLALMQAEIAPNVELYQGNPRVPHSFEERRFIAVHGEHRH